MWVILCGGLFRLPSYTTIINHPWTQNSAGDFQDDLGFTFVNFITYKHDYNYNYDYNHYNLIINPLIMI
jgi:hypothetical protein